MSTVPTAQAWLWKYAVQGTLTNGYSHAIVVSDLTPPDLVGVNAAGYEVYRFHIGTYDHANGDGGGSVTLQPGESIGYSFEDSLVPFDPVTIVRWVVPGHPETGMLALWSGNQKAITAACGNPGGWRF